VISFNISEPEKEGTTEGSGEGLDSLKGAAEGTSFFALPPFDRLFTLKKIRSLAYIIRT